MSRELELSYQQLLTIKKALAACHQVDGLGFSHEELDVMVDIMEEVETVIEEIYMEGCDNYEGMIASGTVEGDDFDSEFEELWVNILADDLDDEDDDNR